MKKYIILVVSFLLFLGQSSLFAEEFSWKDFVEGKSEWRRKNIDSSEVVIICVEHSDTIDMSTYSSYPLYGDKIIKEEDKKQSGKTYVYYGGHTSEKKEPNSTLSDLLKSEEVMLDSCSDTCRLRAQKPEGFDITVVEWPIAYYKDAKEGYCKSNQMFTLVLIDKAYISKVFEDIAGSGQNPTPDIDISEDPKLNVWLILFGVVCLLLVALTMYIVRLRKIVSNQEKRLSVKEENACSAEELKRDSKDKNVLDESEFIKKIISSEISECIKALLSEQFKKIETRLDKISEGVKLSEPTLVQERKDLRVVTPTEQEDTEFRTRDVLYISNSNKFVLDENPQFSFFEIYVDEGEYYYTLPEDRETRSDFLTYMIAYESCVEAEYPTRNPTIAVPIRDGHLFRKGDSFVVDTNRLLIIELREG